MAVIMAQGNGGGSGFLGGVGTLMQLAGMFIPGAPAWMGAVGKGMSAIDGAMKGNYSGLLDVAKDLNVNVKNNGDAQGQGWMNPAQGNEGGRPKAAPTVQPVPKISTQSASGMFNPNIYDSAARPNMRWSLPGPAQPVSIGLRPLPSATPGHPGQWW